MSEMSLSHETNIYLSHRPLYAVACNSTHYVTLDWTMQQAIANVRHPNAATSKGRRLASPDACVSAGFMSVTLCANA